MASTSAAVIASINPFPNDVRIAFQEFIQEPNYVNRERIEYSKWQRLHVFLAEPDLKPKNATDSRLRYRAYAEFELINNKLYRQSDQRFKKPTICGTRIRGL